METQVSEYIDVRKRAMEFGLIDPLGLTILPRNFDTAISVGDLVHESTAPTIRSLWRQVGVSESRLEREGMKFPQGSKKSWEWVGPIIFISQAMLNNAVVPITLNMISSYLYDLLKGHFHEAEITLEFVVERIEQTKRGETREYKRITIKGSPKEIEALDVNKLKQLAKKARK